MTSKPRAPRIRYSVDTPPNAIGPNDLVSIGIRLQPTDPTVSLRSASVTIERRIQLLDNSNNTLPSPPTSGINSSSRSPSPLHLEIPASASSTSVFSNAQTAPHLDKLIANPEGFISTSSLASSNPTITPHSIFPSSTSVASSTRPLLPSSSTPPPTSNSPHQTKLIVNTIAEAEASGRFTRDTNGVWNKTMTLQWPAAKSHSRWAVGETIQSDLVCVRYYVRIKVCFFWF